MVKTFLSIILPVQNEAERLPLVVADIDQRLGKFPFASEIVVASFGSTDETPEIVRKMSKALKNLKLVVSEENKGEGAAIRQGVLLSSGEIKLVTNIDNSIKIDQFENMRPHFGVGVEVVLGKRIRAKDFLPSLLDDPKILVSLVANFTLKKLFFKDYSDSTSRFCAYTSPAAEKIFEANKNPGRFYHLETLRQIKGSGLKTKEAEVIVA